MRYVIAGVYFALCCTISTAGAQLFKVDTLVKAGPVNNRVNLVFMGDGYTREQLSKFKSDVSNFVTGMFFQTPYKEYKNYFNVFTIEVISSETGVNHPQTSSDSDCKTVPILKADNYFGSTFDIDGIHRLLAPADMIKITNVLGTNFPAYDQAFLIVNTPYYGGSGGAIATGSTHQEAIEIGTHEIGHSFAYVADEYWAGAQYAIEKPNLTQQSDPQKIKWKNWLNTNGVGVYAHDESPTWFRPHQSCKMRYLGYPYCSVCTEAVVERIHELVKPIDRFAPGSSTVTYTTSSIHFSAEPVTTSPSTIRTVWKKNSVVIAKNKNEISIAGTDFTLPQNTVRLEALDTTSLSRIDGSASLHLQVIEWQLIPDDVTGIVVQADEQNYKFSAWPNPFVENLTISYSLSKAADVTILVRDALGRKLSTLVSDRQKAGQYDYHFTADDVRIRQPGVYIFSISFDGALLTQKIIKN